MRKLQSRKIINVQAYKIIRQNVFYSWRLILSMKNNLLVKINDLLQLPRESPQVRNSDGTGSKSVEAILNPSYSTANSRCSPKYSKSICFPEADFKLSLTGNWRWAVQLQRHGMQLASKIKPELLFFREQIVLQQKLYTFLSNTHRGLFWKGKGQTIP